MLSQRQAQRQRMLAGYDSDESDREDEAVQDQPTSTFEHVQTGLHATSMVSIPFEFIPEDPRWKRIQEYLGIDSIREAQAHVLELLSSGKDVLLLARTGWGKSLIFQGMRHVIDPTKNAKRDITIVFVPLSGL